MQTLSSPINCTFKMLKQESHTYIYIYILENVNSGFANVDTRFRTRKRTRIICWKLLLDSEWKPLGRGLSLNLVYMRIAPRHFPLRVQCFPTVALVTTAFLLLSPFPSPPPFFLHHVERIVFFQKSSSDPTWVCTRLTIYWYAPLE